MYKFATFAIIVNLLLAGCASSESKPDYDGNSERPAPSIQNSLETPIDQ